MVGLELVRCGFLVYTQLRIYARLLLIDSDLVMSRTNLKSSGGAPQFFIMSEIEYSYS